MNASPLTARSYMQERSPTLASIHDTATASGDLLNLHEIVDKAFVLAGSAYLALLRVDFGWGNGLG